MRKPPPPTLINRVLTSVLVALLTVICLPFYLVEMLKRLHPLAPAAAGWALVLVAWVLATD